MTVNETDKAILDAIETGADTASGILAALERNGISISQPTLSRRLSALQENRYVRVEGKGRNTRYKADSYNQYFSIPPERRKAVSYDRTILENYVPNQTRWLDPEVSQQLLAAGGGVRAEASTYSRAIAQKLLVDLSYASSSLEGNTYSYLDTQVLIEYGQAAEGSSFTVLSEYPGVLAPQCVLLPRTLSRELDPAKIYLSAVSIRLASRAAASAALARARFLALVS
jgi:DNA-binding transcriptional ArsR family regulator